MVVYIISKDKETRKWEGARKKKRGFKRRNEKTIKYMKHISCILLVGILIWFNQALFKEGKIE